MDGPRGTAGQRPRSARTALVLGVGGFVGQGIIEALALAPGPYWIEAACVTPRSAGLYLADAAQLSPYARDPSFIPWLVSTCRERNIQIVLSGQEEILEVLSANRAVIERETGAVLGVDVPRRLLLTRDKLRMNRWLAKRGYDTAATVPLAGPAAHIQSFLSRHRPPWVVKPRYGRGSRGVSLIRSASDLVFPTGGEEFLLQEFVPEDAAEHSVAVLSDLSGSVVASAAFERALTSGTTTWARLLPAGGASQRVAESLCSQLGTIGPCNAQFRHRPSGSPVCIDVNLRFSSTVAIRASCGFNDVDRAVGIWLGCADSSGDPSAHAAGIAVRRLITQWVDDEPARLLSLGQRVVFERRAVR